MDFLLTCVIYFAVAWVLFNQVTSVFNRFFPKLYSKIYSFICFKCFTFLYVLLVTWGNLPVAAIASLIAHFYEKNNEVEL